MSYTIISQSLRPELGRRFSQIKRCVQGITGIFSAMLFPVLFMFAAIVVDLSYYEHTKLRLEAATDTVALHLAGNASATRNISARITNVQTVLDEAPTAILIGGKNLPDFSDGKAITLADVTVGEWNFKTNSFNDTPPFSIVNAVRVTGELSPERNNQVPQFFSKVIGKETTIKTISYAYIPPVPNIHALNETASFSFVISGSADVDAFDAWVNSASSFGTYLNTRSFAGWGGVGIFTPGRAVLRGSATRVRDRIVDDMFVLPDLLADTPDPNFTNCAEVLASDDSLNCRTLYNHVVNAPGRDVELDPGIYVGGLHLQNARSVTLKPGVYVMRNGPFRTSGSVPVSGDNVLLNFTGSRSARLIHQGGSLTLRGLSDGPYQGFVIYSDRDSTRGAAHSVGAGLNFVGTIYVPTGTLTVTAYANGSCHSLCVVSDKFRASSLLNIYPSQSVSGFGKTPDFPAPLSLIPSLLPVLTHITNPQPEGEI
ncbi:MAG: TadE/TadG family type IV pilus assembly protein [Pseudomonadota bacterium]